MRHLRWSAALLLAAPAAAKVVAASDAAFVVESDAGVAEAPASNRASSCC